MSEKKVAKIIAFLQNNLREQRLNITKIILFGSYAKGGASAESDIDIVIVSGDFRNKNIFERVNLIKNAEIKTIKKFMMPLDIITLTPEELENEASLISGYAKQGKVLFAA